MTSATVDRLDLLVTPTAIKAPVRVATTANISFLSGLLTVDGVTVADGDRVLVKDQTDQTANGIYNASTGVWTRALDFSTNSDVSEGTAVFVSEGTANALTTWVITTTGTIVLGTSNITFAVTDTGKRLFLDSQPAFNWPSNGKQIYEPNARIHRLNDRVLIGAATDNTGIYPETPGSGQDWLENTIANTTQLATLATINPNGYGYSFVAGIRCSDSTGVVGATDAFGIGSFALMDDTTDTGGSDRNAWAYYGEARRAAAAPFGAYSHGIELAMLNLSGGTVGDSTPYATFTNLTQAGIWLSSGKPGVTTTDSTVAIGISNVASKFKVGLNFDANGLTGSDGTTGTASAIRMGKGHQVEWWASGSSAAVATIRSDATSASAITQVFSDTGIAFSKDVSVTGALSATTSVTAATVTTTGNILGPNLGLLRVVLSNVDFSTGGVDTAFTVALPTGFTAFEIDSIRVANTGTVASWTTAQAGVYTAAAGGGTAIISPTALSGITSNTANTSGNATAISGPTNFNITLTTLYFRVTTGQAAGATGNVVIFIRPLY